MAWLIASRPGSSNKDQRIRGAQLTIGRGDCDLRLDDMQVSRRHCRVLVEGRRYVIVDDRSRFGTFLNGHRMRPEEPYSLTRHDSVTVGPFTIVLRHRLPTDDRTTRKPTELPLLIGQSPAIRRIQTLIHRLAPHPHPVLIRGETGTGKSLVARLIHGLSPRHHLEIVNAGSLTSELAESKLYGHEKGAFTGADERQDGHFQRAHKGTLFLDEIGDMPLDQQHKLLLAIDRGDVQRVRGQGREPVDVRIVAATHHDLERGIREGTFRADLYYRLKGHELVLPPLRERPEDVPELARALLSANYPQVEISDRALAALSRQPWPGNVRELEQALHRAACLLEPGQTIDVGVLEGKVKRPPPSRERVIRALKLAGGQRPTAELLRITRSMLRRLIVAYGITKEDLE